MPELPEAERSRRAVEKNCLHRTIEEAMPGDDSGHVELPGANERGRLEGRQFTETRRHGKMIFAGSASGPWIVVHLGMTGRLIPYDEADGVPDYAKFIIRFDGDRRLAFRNPRKLGSLTVIDDPQAYIDEKGYGPDALEISASDFARAMGDSRGAIKSALMAQKKLAGIGNLWSDEILFHAGIHPETKGSELSGEGLDSLYEAMGRVLGKVVDLDADYSRLPSDWLVPNREEGADCPRCGGTFEKKTVGGRSAYFCPEHQGRG
jgi:formamidopyrimidine-DNA glycosylase